MQRSSKYPSLSHFLFFTNSIGGGQCYSKIYQVCITVTQTYDLYQRYLYKITKKKETLFRKGFNHIPNLTQGY